MVAACKPFKMPAKAWWSIDIVIHFVTRLSRRGAANGTGLYHKLNGITKVPLQALTKPGHEGWHEGGTTMLHLLRILELRKPSQLRPTLVPHGHPR